MNKELFSCNNVNKESFVVYDSYFDSPVKLKTLTFTATLS